MTFRKAVSSEAETICKLVRNTIMSVYPKYYATYNVQFFCDLHSINSIKSDIADGIVYVIEDNGKIVCTVSRRGAHIFRLFTQFGLCGRSYGRTALTSVEKLFPPDNNFFNIEASIPSVQFYIRAGYSFVRRESAVTKDGLLEYDVMHKAFEASETE